MWIEATLTLIISMGVTVALIPAAIRLAVKIDAIDYPSERRVNMSPVPRLGGVAMFGGLIAGLIAIAIGSKCFGWPTPFVPHPNLNVNYIGVGIGLVCMFAVGFVDDLKNLPPKQKIVGQTIAACIVAGSGILLSEIRNPFDAGYISFGVWAYPITVFYLVAFANIINLIDGLDGLAAGITTITAATIFVFSCFSGRFDAALLCVILVGICAGFLTKNKYPAAIFMGDSGALTLGFTLGIVSLLAVARSALVLSLAVPILAAGVPIIDTVFAIIRRKRQHKHIDEADKGHIHHQLMRAGFSQTKTAAIMCTWTAVLSVGSLLIVFLDSVYRIPVIIVIVVLSGVLIKKLHLLGPVLAHHYNPRGRFRAGDSLSGAVSKQIHSDDDASGESTQDKADGSDATRAANSEEDHEPESSKQEN